MLHTKLQKTLSYQSYYSLKETINHNISDPNINEALTKFYELNNMYHVDNQTHPIFHQRSKNDEFNCIRKNGRVDGFTIMAQLRHLENVAEISKAEQEKNKRNSLMKKQVHSIRKKNKWKKAQNTLNQPYLETYKNWIKEKQQECQAQNLLLDKQSEEEKSQHSSKPSQSQLTFKKELRPYQKFVQFTKRKIKLKKQSALQDLETQSRAKSVDHIKSSTYKTYYKEYSQLAKKLVQAQEKQKLKNDKSCCVQTIIDKQMSRIFKKSNQKNKFQYQKQEKFSKLIKTQQTILRKSTSASCPLQGEARKNLKQKFEHINSQIFKGARPVSQKNSRMRLTKSVQIKRSISTGQK